MRELSVRIKFTTPCLGKERKHYRDPKTQKVRFKFVFIRSPNGRVVFLPTWWRAITLKAAELLAKHQDAARDIRFGCEVDGQPDKELYTRWYDESKFSDHEAFSPGDIIGFTCVVPNKINDEDFERLLNYAGRYFGISPARPNEYGFFEVVSIRRSGVGGDREEAADKKKSEQEKITGEGKVEGKRNRRFEVAN